MNHLMDYGPDWPPPAPEPRERRPRAACRHLLLNAALLVGAFLIVAALAVISDQPQHVEFPMTSSTTTPHVSSTHTQGTP